jgi:hypothetical protein
MGFAAIATAALLLLRGNEDTWLCTDGQWVAHGHPAAPIPQEDCGNPAPIADFNETGHLASDLPGLKPGTWYLVYEKPGAPALTAQLWFASSSVCVFNSTRGTCPDALLLSSAMTHVTGMKKTDGSIEVLTATTP